MPALFVTDLVKHGVGRRIAGRTRVQVVGFRVLGRLPRREQPIDGRDPGLQS